MTDTGMNRIAAQWGLGAVHLVVPIGEGSVTCFRLQTTTGRYFVKPGETHEALQRYSVVECTLNAAGVRQAHVYTTQDGIFISRDGYAVYEMLDGYSREQPSRTEFDSFIQYLAHYNKALRTLSLSDPALAIQRLHELDNPFAKADSVAYLLKQLWPQLDELCATQQLDHETNKVAHSALAYLETKQHALAELPLQLIHGDLGPGNILYHNDAVAAIIDFTPYIESHWYALCVALYWHCVYFSLSRPLDLERITRAIQIYAEKLPPLPSEVAMFHALFVKAAARMLFVEIIFNHEHSRLICSKQSIAEKVMLLQIILDAEQMLQAAITASIALNA